MAPAKLSAELQHTRVQLRITMALLLSTMFFALVDPAIYILTVPGSFYDKVGRALHEPELLAASFFGIACSLVPHCLAQLFWPTCAARRATAKLACFGLFAAGALWIFLAWFVWHWDVPTVSTVFTRLGLGAIAFSIVIAVWLNDELMRGCKEPTP